MAREPSRADSLADLRPRLRDLPALAGLLAGRLAGDPLFDADGAAAPVRYLLLWIDVAWQLARAWALHEVVADRRRAVLTWVIRAPHGTGRRIRSQRHTARLALGLALGLVPALAGMLLLSGPIWLFHFLLLLKGASATRAAVATGTFVLVAGAALRLGRRQDPELAGKAAKEDDPGVIQPGHRALHPAGNVLWLGIAASTVPGATDTFTTRLFRTYPGLVEARAHVANPLTRDKATSRGARAYETKALPNGHQRWQVALVPPGPPPHPRQDH